MEGKGMTASTPKMYYGVSSEESKRKLPLALFEYEANAEEWRNKYLRTGVITSWFLDRYLSESLMGAVAMRIVDKTMELLNLRAQLAEKEQQVKNLEEYTLKGVAFRDELQTSLSLAEKVVIEAKMAVMGYPRYEMRGLRDALLAYDKEGK